MPRFFAVLVFVLIGNLAAAQSITVATVTRPPFSLEQDAVDTGFSVDLMVEAAARIGQEVDWLRLDSFADMLAAVQDGRADAAIANISITAERETLMDFSQPVFASGIQVMLPPATGTLGSMLAALLTPQIGVLILTALAILFGFGMVMWLAERRRQPYFDRSAREAFFPAFWWALNLVVNGGFEERMPQSRLGRLLAPFMVVSSLFIVSIFVANITAALTVDAIAEQFEDFNDLNRRSVGTVANSTSEALLDQRGVQHEGYPDTETLFAAFEAGTLTAVVFDGPILAYYVNAVNQDGAMLHDRVYRPENYGIAFPTASPLREQMDQVILSMYEDGTYDRLVETWFGETYSER